MLKVIQHFGKHCICSLQGEYLLVGCFFWKLYIEQAVGGELVVMVLIGGAGCYPIGDEHMVEEKR
jgi:hypothetical protein